MTTHRLFVSHWTPATVNQLLDRCWQRAYRRKRVDKDMVAHYGKDLPRATTRRRVSLAVALAPKQRAPDPDAWWKSTLDALVSCGLLIDDSPRWCELGTVTSERGTADGWGTTITLEDIP